MEIKKIVKESFSVIGKESYTEDGDGRIPGLVADANAHRSEIEHLLKKDENGELVGIWGAMSGVDRNFTPWADNFSKGLYLAGFEVEDDAVAPEGWVKWTVPGFEYAVAKKEGENFFYGMVDYLNKNNTPPVAAIHDFTDPKTKIAYMYFPIRRL